MHLTTRRRFVIALLLSWPVAYFYIAWCLFNGMNIFRVYRGNFPVCDLGWRSAGNGCDPATFNTLQAWGEIAFFTAAAAGLIALVGRWVLAPVRQITHTVDAFGPASLGLRTNVRGPRRDETRRLGEAIDAMLDRVAEGYEVQSRFAANASHELRTPLATQRALIEVSLMSALTQDQLDLVARQLLATNARNEALIEGLLVLAESDRGLVTRSEQRLDLLAAGVVETLRPSAKERGVDIEVEATPVTVPGEAPLLERLVANLVQNAVKYNVEGGTVRVHVDAPGRLSVANTGPRVPPEQVPGLFEPFRRASGDRLDHGGGVGLGLTIVRSIVGAHRGRVEAWANPDGGLLVAVDLPPV